MQGRGSDAFCLFRLRTPTVSSTGAAMKTLSSFGLTLFWSALLLIVPARPLHADADCLSCHSDTTMQDASGKSVGVDANKFTPASTAVSNAATATRTFTTIRIPITLQRSSAKPATPMKPPPSPAASTPKPAPRSPAPPAGKRIPAPAAMATPTKLSQRQIQIPPSTR